MFKKKIEELNDDAPQYFKDWFYVHFLPVKSRSKRNEALIYVILASVVLLNTVGNYWHEEIFQFIARLFS